MKKALAALFLIASVSPASFAGILYGETQRCEDDQFILTVDHAGKIFGQDRLILRKNTFSKGIVHEEEYTKDLIILDEKTDVGNLPELAQRAIRAYPSSTQMRSQLIYLSTQNLELVELNTEEGVKVYFGLKNSSQYSVFDYSTDCRQAAE